MLINYFLSKVSQIFNKQNMNISQKYIFKSFFYIICLIGSLYQIYEISEIYFLYETTTYVKYENEAKISLPAITLCARKAILC